MDHQLFVQCKEAFSKGQNIMELIKKSYPNNRSLAIEIAYDLQAGDYIKDFYKNKEKKLKYTDEGGALLEKFINNESVLLNVGAGELWTISLMLDSVKNKPNIVYNLEISWSRINKGCKFWNTIHKKNLNMRPFVADMLKVPLPSKSVDIVTSSHALEPNGGKLEMILKELFRVTRYKCVLFEPSYENAPDEGKRRMDKLGYIKNIEKVVRNLGGELEKVIPLVNTANKLNPTACFIITPSNSAYSNSKNIDHFSMPGTDYILEFNKDCYYSKDTGFAFPILGGIPIFKDEYAILASKYGDLS